MAEMDRAAALRWIGIAASIACAVIYALIGVGVVSVGTSATDAAAGATPDLLAFGGLMAGFSLVIALALWRLQSRLWLAIVAAAQLVPLLGYIAVAGVREPPFELWGLVIKVAQVIVFTVATILALTAPTPSTETMKGHAA